MPINSLLRRRRRRLGRVLGFAWDYTSWGPHVTAFRLTRGGAGGAVTIGRGALWPCRC